MPELPEVETVMRGLEPALSGKRFAKIDVYSPALRIPIPRSKILSLIGIKIRNLERRAKYILIHFENQKTMVVHLGMTGSFTILTISEFKKFIRDRHDHIVFATSSKHMIVFRDPRRFGMIDVIDQGDILSYKPLANLGPEPLENSFTADVLAKAIATRSSPIKPVLMDQKIVVGVGNIYASEALYMSGISPLQPANNIPLKKLKLLVQNIKKILSAAIDSGGSTLRDYRNAKGELGYFQFQFSVDDKEGDACTNCTCNLSKTGGILRIMQAGRSTFFCATRQKLEEKA